MDALTIAPDTPATPDVSALLTRHFELMRSQSPEESCHVMQPEALLEKRAVLLAARDASRLLAVGALTVIADGHGELKSMHTTAEARGRGVGRALLRALLDTARRQGLHTVSLETGTDVVFAPARALYHAEGFNDCPPFGSYQTDPLSVFMTRSL